MKATIRIFTDEPYTIEKKEWPSLAYVRGVAKKHIRNSGLIWTHAILFLEENKRLGIRMDEKKWKVERL